MRAVSSYLRSAGHEVQWLVGRLHELETSVSAVFEHDKRRSAWSRAFIFLGKVLWHKIGRYKTGRGICRFLINEIGQPIRTVRRNLGHEDFEFPDSVQAVRRVNPKADILHFHGLHSDYFDLRALEELSRQHSIVITMHDVWLITGHCAYPGECSGYERGCGKCPDLNRFPKIKRDATAYNFKRKHKIYQSSEIHLVTPSEWLMGLVESSQMADAFKTKTVIPNGIADDLFVPGSQKEARERLGLGGFDDVILYCAKNARSNMHKDYKTAREAVERYARSHPDRNIVFQVIGEEAAYEVSQNLVVRFIALSGDSETMVDYYRAADVLVHTSLDENFPTVVLEAMACSRPVIVSDTGGMREQVISLKSEGAELITGACYDDLEESSGILVPRQDVESVERALNHLLSNREMIEILGKNGRRRFLENYTLSHMGKRYESLFQNILN